MSHAAELNLLRTLRPTLAWGGSDAVITSGCSWLTIGQAGANPLLRIHGSCDLRQFMALLDSGFNRGREGEAVVFNYCETFLDDGSRLRFHQSDGVSAKNICLELADREELELPVSQLLELQNWLDYCLDNPRSPDEIGLKCQSDPDGILFELENALHVRAFIVNTRIATAISHGLLEAAALPGVGTFSVPIGGKRELQIAATNSAARLTLLQASKRLSTVQVSKTELVRTAVQVRLALAEGGA